MESVNGSPLSVWCGSMCGSLWCVRARHAGYMTVMLLVERNTEIRFTPDEYSVFEEHFMPHGYGSG